MAHTASSFPLFLRSNLDNFQSQLAAGFDTDLLGQTTFAAAFNSFQLLQDPVDICVENGQLSQRKSRTSVTAKTAGDSLTGSTAMCSPRIETADLSIQSRGATDGSTRHFLKLPLKTHLFYGNDLH
jgi:hypothetical protein